MSRKLRPALDLISAIGVLGFDLQHHSDRAIADAMTLMRTVNPEMFAWLSKVLGEPPSADAVDPVGGRVTGSDRA